MKEPEQSILSDKALLLNQFNKREPLAFGEVYNLFYHDFHFYTSSLFENLNVDSHDIIQDIFMDLWQKNNITFDELIKIKAFVIIAIKNKFKNHLRHLRHEKVYIDKAVKEFEYDVIESELYSIVSEAIGLLPKECGAIFSLYLEGWKPDEIATTLNKKQQTVYNYKQEAITILRKKLSKDKLLIILFLLHFYE